MKKLMFAAVVGLCGTVFADGESIESANIVGYSYVQAPSYYSFFTPIFKDTDATAKAISIQDIKPVMTNGNAIASSARVKIYFYGDTENGLYAASYNWMGSTEGGIWVDSTSTKANVTIDPGTGFVLYNNIRINNATGAEATTGSKTTRPQCPINLRVSGEVDLVCKQEFAPFYSFAGNNTPVVRNIQDFRPVMTNGNEITSSARVKLYRYGDTENGLYEASYNWMGSLNGGTWVDSTSTAADINFQPGEGFVLYNNIRINNANGAEATTGSKTTRPQCPIFLKVKNPLTNAFN